MSLLLYLLVSGISYAATDPNVLPIVAAGIWCPYACKADAPQQGYLVDLMEEVFGHQGRTIKYETLPWARAFSQTEKGITKAALGVVSGDYGNLLPNQEVLAWDRTALMMRKGEGRRFLGPETLDGLRIGMIADFTYDDGGPIDTYLAERLANHDNIIALNMDEPLPKLLEMLVHGRVDVVLENSDVLAYTAKQSSLQDQVDIVPTEHGDSIHIAFTPNEEGLHNLQILDEGVRRLRANGRLQEIKGLYGLNDSRPPKSKAAIVSGSSNGKSQ